MHRTIATTSKYISLLIVLALGLSLLVIPAAAADLPDSLYLIQSSGGRCTLASAAMLVRSALYNAGSDQWSSVTEQTLASSAWCSAGLYWTFSHTAGGLQVTVEHSDRSGLTLDGVKALLESHPEGFVLYCSGLPHAVFVTDCIGGTVYCADPVNGTRTTLADSTLDRCGGQDDILRCVTSTWCVTEVAAA